MSSSLATAAAAACSSAAAPRQSRVGAKAAAPRAHLSLAAPLNRAALLRVAAAPKAARRSVSVSAAATVMAATKVPTVADTKRAFIEAYPKPMSALYNTVVQEFLVQHHLMRYQSMYEYDPIMAMGFCSVFDQVTEGMGAAEVPAIFKAYIEALGEDPAKYRADAEKLQKLAGEASAADLKPDASGTELQKILAAVADSEKFYYTKWFGIGLFRILELAGATEPKALETLVADLGVKADSVNKDLMMYKGVLSKMNAARELMAEMMAREKKKQAERDAEKAAKAEAEAAPAEASS
mmetsp:Transcript_31597/g.80975  ORF Transcript_31597/g.80975 Transcript_31597/m.80975 type:complete len:295 (-) Transcript_31597:269-1153(-)|eukprot:jgi/Tetstr1/444033/TSEL_031972.t1